MDCRRSSPCKRRSGCRVRCWRTLRVGPYAYCVVSRAVSFTVNVVSSVRMSILPYTYFCRRSFTVHVLYGQSRCQLYRAVHVLCHITLSVVLYTYCVVTLHVVPYTYCVVRQDVNLTIHVLYRQSRCLLYSTRTGCVVTLSVVPYTYCVVTPSVVLYTYCVVTLSVVPYAYCVVGTLSILPYTYCVVFSQFYRLANQACVKSTANSCGLSLEVSWPLPAKCSFFLSPLWFSAYILHSGNTTPTPLQTRPLLAKLTAPECEPCWCGELVRQLPQASRYWQHSRSQGGIEQIVLRTSSLPGTPTSRKPRYASPAWMNEWMDDIAACQPVAGKHGHSRKSKPL